ncbi:MAG: hypothetical protein DWQ53_23750 [Microcystis flos-aquae DF17]|uniref:hypothetical protein n=1 Tax=Microcystis TaxID=1125 RepID=UPI000E37B77A|nr:MULTISPECIES: hypothetical protein [Microcystis]MDJ0671770.1 hypothetical protein [Microcystis sp. M53598_WE2]REJ39005.1 MAG: hypothetical protein DWQ53_23750 [Microcystis flos-aquae DF17]
MRNPARERSRNLNREVWESPSVYGGEDVKLGEVFAIATIVSGRFLKRRQRYWFSFVMACILCLFTPLGTILGVFTIIVLSRQSVKELYGLPNADTVN